MAESDQRRYPVTGFILVGFPEHQDLQSRLLSLFLTVYVLIVLGNISMLYMVTTDKRLHVPMYFLVANLAAMDVVLTSSVIPQMLVKLVFNIKVILWSNCFIQMYFFHSISAAKTLLLTVMAYDRSVAICNPQHYLSLRRDAFFVKLAGLTWVLGMASFLPPIVLTSIFPFCGPNEVYNSFCELLSVMSLICADTISVKFINLILNAVFVILSFLTILWFYIKICKLVKVASSEQRKVLATCIGHLLVLSLFFPSMVLYSALFYVSHSLPIIHIAFALVYVTLSPLLSPIIYILAAKEIRDKVAKFIRVQKVFPNVGSTVAVESH
ncbi:olfactory receptor 6N1-like isoform X1 [Stegostoma tigrinum]|uniref:olfactory receptor 6N1-like isoform X1 n=1 Tax=Stegostoma tigrinum TaxID=3053191 RepID=UPI00202AE937|nr:olfactory receptor 6N1-like isoform X1 [Stegostoma tigrinum]XP_048381993.1 olfactory receptor 6N1-like isoform X1 [Stegostoma tigrinum]